MNFFILFYNTILFHDMLTKLFLFRKKKIHKELCCLIFEGKEEKNNFLTIINRFLKSIKKVLVKNKTGHT